MVYLIPYGEVYVLTGLQLKDRTTGQFKVAPTLAAGDFKIEKDGGAAANLATLPTVTPAGGSSVSVSFSATEVQAKQIVLRASDQAGAEWDDTAVYLLTVGNPNAFFEFDLSSASVALSLASQGAVTGGTWDELVDNHQLAATFGKLGKDTGTAVTDIQAKVLELRGMLEDLSDVISGAGGAVTPAEVIAQTRVANHALQKLGANLITSMDEDTREARTVKACYSILRDRELRAHSWNFSVKRAVLAPSATVPVFGFAKAFPLPADCLRVLPPARDVDWSVENIDGVSHILTNEGTVLNLRYVARITDEAAFDELFVDMLACKIAWHCCETITQSNQKKADVMNEYQDARAEARRINAFEQASPQEPEPPWLTARRTGNSGQNWLRFGSEG
jgi:hypothetical protein